MGCFIMGIKQLQRMDSLLFTLMAMVNTFVQNVFGARISGGSSLMKV